MTTADYALQCATKAVKPEFIQETVDYLSTREPGMWTRNLETLDWSHLLEMRIDAHLRLYLTTAEKIHMVQNEYIAK